MKRLFLGLTGIITLILTSATPAFASANDFYFDSFEADYYLSKNSEGSGTMHIDEVLTAVFPTINQNHGIERCIPKKYNGTSILRNANFSVLKNSAKEPFTTYNDGKFLCLRIGDANVYVRGTQTYTISYDVENVILEPNNSEYQELYWDANGTGWSQKFTALTARVHLPEGLNAARKTQLTSDLSCYVGAYGTSSSTATSRCAISSDPDNTPGYDTVLTFITENLRAGENLTFNIEFMPKSFFVKGPDPNYALFIIVGLAIIAIALLVIYWVKANQKVKDKKAIAKDKAVPVQYTPPKGLTVAEAGTVWLKSSKSLQVATLMQLAVTHKIELEKGEKKRFGGYHWKVHVKDIDGISAEQKIILEILNGGLSVHNGNTIEIQRHSSTSHLEKLGRDFSKKIEGNLRGKRLFESEKATKSGKAVTLALTIIGIFFVFAILGSAFIQIIISIIESLVGDTGGLTFVLGFFIFIAAISVFGAMAANISKYKKRTAEGIKISKYLDGLKEYMELAEEERLKFLQSVEGADTTHNGIVKLYEKLLPYAVIFGIEDSWMSELNKYYQMDDIDSPYWLHGATYFPISDFRSFTSYTSSSIYSSTASSDSGGSSGGGGGGFSGGGGGGGGGGGW